MGRVSSLVKTKSLTTITNFYPDVQAIKYFCNTKIFKTLEYDQSLKSGQKEGVLIFQLQLVIDKKFFHHSSPANNPANSYYVNKKLFTSKINDLQIRYPVCQMCNARVRPTMCVCRRQCACAADNARVPPTMRMCGR